MLVGLKAVARPRRLVTAVNLASQPRRRRRRGGRLSSVETVVALSKACKRTARANVAAELAMSVALLYLSWWQALLTR